MTVTDTINGGSDRTVADLRKLRETTGRVMGSIFFGTLLKTMRESELKGKYGHGGRAEEVFAGQLDAILAERMGQATHGSVGDALYRALAQQQRRISGQRIAASGNMP